MTTYNLMDGAAGRPGIGSSGTTPPAAGTAYAGNYIAGLVFKVTTGGLWLSGYRWYVAASGQDTAALKCALWNIKQTGQAALNSAGTVTAPGAFTAGQWNTISLAAPIALTPNIPYIAAIGGVFTTGFPDTTNQFGNLQPYHAGVTNGPVHAYGNDDGAAAGNWSLMPFSTGGSDPAVTVPATNNANDNLWLDVTITDVAPAGAAYRAWPNMAAPWPTPSTTTDQTGYTLGLQFSLSQSCALQKIWHYSPAGSTVLPSRCCIWDVNSQAEVAGTDNAAPAWKNPDGSAASPAAGWVYCDYSGAGVTLLSGTQYKASTFAGPGANWFAATASTFGAGQLQAAGFTSGPLTIPGNASASPGQQSWHTVTFAYPGTSTNPEADWLDVEVIPAAETATSTTLALAPMGLAAQAMTGPAVVTANPVSLALAPMGLAGAQIKPGGGGDRHHHRTRGRGHGR